MVNALQKRLSASVDLLYAHRCLTAATRRRAVKRIAAQTALARRQRATLAARIVRRARIPCTPSEIAAMTRKSLHLVRAILYQMKDQRRLRRLDRRVVGPTGRKEYLWVAADVSA